MTAAAARILNRSSDKARAELHRELTRQPKRTDPDYVHPDHKGTTEHPCLELARAWPTRAGDKKQARRRVNYLVEQGRLANPNTVPCADCGHIGSGPRHEYDHHNGYGPAHQLDVQAVCSSCHHTREATRRAA